ncbi:hypothetical protein [Mycobacteroides abscessus]|uniref:hypothetical protein n=1 Tax=Mycobacteroides abscessus TaxID=36809 RepID=UPI00092C845B|nr:hypothetical protein [Mycobacteroides abscessus]DAZ90348.1 TPA_asm: hypothetical protein PROPHIFSQJ01-1_62 [Mycobacterium phage prophiFSQJ01-1]SII41376.1 Uncharacterised protein [Mycobacteroides abscessus subsp. abscessus]SIK13799.1 Uncharacterised protein [Mycobacteroides abscessus subsp. abscessus]SIN25606.1 Uncharacterised protein [Mycobacteroides abscessus subsp. abscessus]SLI51313.1 Uncharacterised protein [Mycobacteroides abscessus subsp. abscessus]
MASSRIRIKHKISGYYKTRSAPGVVKDLENRASRVADAANSDSGTGGFKTSSRQGAKRPEGRWRTTVIPTTFKAIRHNAKHNTLVKRLHG